MPTAVAGIGPDVVVAEQGVVAGVVEEVVVVVWELVDAVG